MVKEQISYCFQKAEGNIHRLYIYDDVQELGEFDWNTWDYKQSETSAKYFKEKLEEIPKEHSIELHINSNGGSVKEGVAIYNLLKQKECHKIGVVDGVAYSIAFVILQACDERVMGVGTSALVHDMWVYTMGNARELRKQADDLDVLMEANRKIFLERANITEQELIDMMEQETYLTPDMALEYGLIDKIDYKEKDLQVPTTVEEQMQQLKGVVEQQKAFHQELEKLHRCNTKLESEKPTFLFAKKN